MSKKKRRIKVCAHCREPFYHRSGCLTYIAAYSAMRKVKRSDRTVEVDGTKWDFLKELDQ